MPNPAKQQREQKEFNFRRRYDYFLHFKLLDADNEEIIQTAHELGFQLNIDVLEKASRAKTRKKRVRRNGGNREKKLSLLNHLGNFLLQPLRLMKHKSK